MIKLRELNARSREINERQKSESRARWEARLPEIRRRLEAGCNCETIGRRYGVGGHWIREVLRRYGKAGAA